MLKKGKRGPRKVSMGEKKKGWKNRVKYDGGEGMDNERYSCLTVVYAITKHPRSKKEKKLGFNQIWNRG